MFIQAYDITVTSYTVCIPDIRDCESINKYVNTMFLWLLHAYVIQRV